MTIVVDSAGLSGLATALRAAGSELDAVTAGAPSRVDAGLAAGVVGDMLATVADVVTRLAHEAQHLAALVDESNAAWTAQESSALDDLALLSGCVR